MEQIAELLDAEGIAWTLVPDGPAGMPALEISGPDDGDLVDIFGPHDYWWHVTLTSFGVLKEKTKAGTDWSAVRAAKAMMSAPAVTN